MLLRLLGEDTRKPADAFGQPYSCSEADTSNRSQTGYSPASWRKGSKKNRTDHREEMDA